MRTHQLVYYGQDVLREKAQPVERVDEALLELVDSMARIMYENRGIGLAAPQVGVARRLILVDIGDELNIYVNPEIVDVGPECEVFEEGCLSLPEVSVAIDRPTRIVLEYTDLEEQRRREELSGLMARVVQHEVDHLEGRMIVDYLGMTDREAMKKKLREIARKGDRKFL